MKLSIPTIKHSKYPESNYSYVIYENTHMYYGTLLGSCGTTQCCGAVEINDPLSPNLDRLKVFVRAGYRGHILRRGTRMTWQGVDGFTSVVATMNKTYDKVFTLYYYGISDDTQLFIFDPKDKQLWGDFISGKLT